MAELLQDNALCAEIFDYLIIPSTVYGDQVRFGIQTNSTNPRFARLFFRTRRPLEDFQDFVQFMASRHPDVIVPPLPFDEADPDEDRDLLLDKVALLHQYCTNLFEIQEIFDDPCLPLFVQSHRPMAEIREILANPEAAAASYGDYQRVLINDGNAQQAAAAAANNDQQAPADDANAQQAAGNNDRQVPANDGNAQQAAAANNDRQVPANDGNAQQAAAVAGNNDRQVPANDGNAQPAAAAAAAGNNDRQVPANDGNAQPAAAANNDQQVPPNDGNAQPPAAAAANNDQQVPPNDGNAQQAAAAAANNDQKVPPNDGKAQQAAANNDQQVPANIRHAQHAAASNNQQVAAMRNQNGNESSEEDLTEGNLSGSESDETIFHMEDI